MSLDDQELSARIQGHATRHVAPDALRAAVRAQVALADAAKAETARGAAEPWWRRGWRFPGLTAAAGFALGIVFAFAALPLLSILGPGEPIEAVLVTNHVQALRAGPLIEVASTDRHTVKPWFQGRIDYAPPVFDLSAEGFPLQGGRIERIDRRATATLIYARNRHVIDLFVWPSAGPEALTHHVQRGFNLLHWADGSMQYWAVSDLERTEILRFAQDWQARSLAP